jgi:hypothetical protein
MPETLFIASQRFDPIETEKWAGYIAWAKIPGLVEVVSLDALLCPYVITEFLDEEWTHIVNEDFRLNYFRDFDYLMRRLPNTGRLNILGLYRNPETHYATAPAVGNFTFAGYDLIEEMTMISALTNCGGFPDVFSNDELNQVGLISQFVRAAEVQRNLRLRHPDEHHANCELYAIWRMNAVTQ